MVNLLIATCRELPGFEKDDNPFFAELTRRGIIFQVVPWDDISDASTFDACLIRTTWDYVTRWKEFQEWTNRVSKQTLLLNSAEIIAWNIDKRYLRFLHERGVPIAPTIWLNESVDLKIMLEENNWGRGFLKPIIGACASDTFRFSKEDTMEAQTFLDEHCSKKEMILQPYLSRVEEEGEYSAIFFGGIFSHAVQKIPLPGEYRVQDDFGASDEAIDPPKELLELSVHALGHVPFSWLYARVDALRTDKGEWVLNELEMIEPSLFFRHSQTAPSLFCDALISTCVQSSS
jgi:glutathione synthase/RimK-type ligase-like ATP-grasp enzyme